MVEVNGQQMSIEALVAAYEESLQAEERLKPAAKKALRRRRQEQSLKPYQAELIRMQQYLEETGRRMVILFEGRDASGKGGTIRR
ncbi:MAG TPA: polyphosphate kinase 2, partial [Gammaproteobacteria bacterium]|nr:polyphosphate kinase 2 [Gammaproteobacteria bacterium]